MKDYDHFLYFRALTDIYDLLRGHAPMDLFQFLMEDGAFSRLLRYAYGTEQSCFDLSTDFPRIVGGLHRLAEQFPESPWSRSAQARALVALGNYESAIREFEMAARIAPECAFIPLFCGEAYYYLAGKATVESLDHYVSALCYLSDAILLNPVVSRAYICRAHCQAHIIDLCEYPVGSARYALAYDKIQKDIRAAYEHSGQAMRCSLRLIARDIHAVVLGTKNTQ